MSTENTIPNNCLFCETTSVKITKTKTKSRSFVKIFSLGKSESFEESEMDCPICFRKYKAFFGTNEDYFKKHVVFSDLMLSDLIRFFPNTERNSIIDLIFNNFIGIAQMKKNRMKTKEYNLLFELENKRAYLHCKKDKKDFKVISVNEV